MKRILERANQYRAAQVAVLATLFLLILSLQQDPQIVMTPDRAMLTHASCATLGYGFGFKIDGASNGTFRLVPGDGEHTGGAPSDPDHFITLSNSDGSYLDWAAPLGIDAAIVSSGKSSFLYTYDPEAQGGTGLHAPVDPKTGKPREITHIEFCYDYELEISDETRPHFTRTYQWTIDAAAVPDTWYLLRGDSGTSIYSVTVEKAGYTDSDWQIKGALSIHNPSPRMATLTGVSDSAGGVPVTVHCGARFPFRLHPGQTLSCAYSADVPDGSPRTHAATVKARGAVEGGSLTTDIVFGEPTQEVNGRATVKDTDGESWTFENSASVSYARTFFCDADAGQRDSRLIVQETRQSDMVSVTVQCYALDIAQALQASFTRTYAWDISARADPAEQWLFAGDTATNTYTVALHQRGYTESDWEATGVIEIHNPAPIAAQIDEVLETVPGIGSGKVDCGDITFPYSLEPRQTLTCSYSTSLPDKSTRGDRVVTSIRNYSYESQGRGEPLGTTRYRSSSEANFDQAMVRYVNMSVTVTDTNGITREPVSQDDTWSYDKTFSCSREPADYLEGHYLLTPLNVVTIEQTGQRAETMPVIHCYVPVIDEQIRTSFHRQWYWTIDKRSSHTQAATSALSVAAGQPIRVGYQVAASALYADSEWAVQGAVTVGNPNPKASMEVALVEMLSPNITPALDCGGSLTVPAGQRSVCGYSVDLPDGSMRASTILATFNGISLTKTTRILFDSPTERVGECIEVNDDLYGRLGAVCDGDLPKTFAYTLPAGPYATCGTYTIKNTASFVVQDTDDTGSDSWMVNVEVPCGSGCTRIPWYWRMHSEYGPGEYDGVWAGLPSGADTPFFLSNQSYYEVLSVPSSDPNVYYSLARQFITAELNLLSGADPAAVEAAFNEASGLLTRYTPTQIGALLGRDPIRRQVTSLIKILGDYNQGRIGPGLCTR